MISTTQDSNYYFILYQKYFPMEQMDFVYDKLTNLDERKKALLLSLKFKDPRNLQLVSILGGSLGIDRFFIGDTALGILKLLTFGCFGVLTIVDWFRIQKRVKERNFNFIMTLL